MPLSCSFASGLTACGYTMSKVTTRSPRELGSLDEGMPLPRITLVYVGVTMSVTAMRSVSPDSRWSKSNLKPHRASTKGTFRWWSKFEPSRVYSGWRFSRMTKITSWAAPVLPISSPSPGKVTLVPAFQPGLMLISSTVSGDRFKVTDDLVTFIFRVAPLYSSSSEQWSSKTAGRTRPSPPKPPGMPPPAAFAKPPNNPPKPPKGDSPKDSERWNESLKNRANMSLGSPLNWYENPPGPRAPPPMPGPAPSAPGPPPLRPSSPNWS
mmetsp:Transcript_118779/g.340976  ORF Transcript_118779/g.340976 Transcript_118779/m.340976 type:complete len:266 (+) Transcript_118779:257-1054(+)